MNTFKVTDQKIVWEFFKNRLDIEWSGDFRGCLYIPNEYNESVMNMNHVAIAVAYNDFRGNLVSIHTVIQKPEFMNKTIVRETFEYPFVVCEREHIIAPVCSTNEAALKFDKKLGFKELHRFVNGTNAGDMVILSMAKGDCRWIRHKEKQDGRQEFTPGT